MSETQVKNKCLSLLAQTQPSWALAHALIIGEFGTRKNPYYEGFIDTQSN